MGLLDSTNKQEARFVSVYNYFVCLYKELVHL